MAAERLPELEKAQALITGGKAREAYALLAPYEFEQAGNPDYDYLLGLAALDSGSADIASVIIERVLAVNANFAGARLDLGRAYFELGDNGSAKTQFLAVLDRNPPLAARRTIENYLHAIEQRQKSARTSITGYLEGGLGRDNNVNNSTGQTSIAVPALVDAIFVLNPSNVQTADNYLGFTGGGEISHQWDDRWSVFAGVDVRNRTNASVRQFDFTSLDGRAGLSFDDGTNLLRASLLAGRFYLDRKDNRHINGAGGEWRRLIDPENQLSAFGQYAQYRFPDETLRPNSFNQSTLGAGWLHTMDHGKTLIATSFFAGYERDTDSRADGGKRFHGLRLGGQKAVSEKAELFANTGAQSGHYDQENAAFLKVREDRQWDLTVGLNWHHDAEWTLRPQVTYVKNSSNISLYQYDRTDLSLWLRRDFR